MPGGMNGRELADEAVCRWPGLRVLLTTGRTRNAVAHHGRARCRRAYDCKPFSLGALSAKVRVLLGS